MQFTTSKPPFITVDKNVAPQAVELLNREELRQECELRQCTYLNNIFKLRTQRFIKSLVKPGMGLRAFNTA